MKKKYSFSRRKIKGKKKFKKPENLKLIRINDKTEVYLDADIPEDVAIKQYLERLENANKQSNKKEKNEQEKIKEHFSD